MFATDRCKLFLPWRSKHLKRLYKFEIVVAEISIHFYSSPPTDSPLGRSNLPRSLYTFEIVAHALVFSSKKPFSWWEIGFFDFNSKLRVSICLEYWGCDIR